MIPFLPSSVSLPFRFSLSDERRASAGAPLSLFSCRYRVCLPACNPKRSHRSRMGYASRSLIPPRRATLRYRLIPPRGRTDNHASESRRHKSLIPPRWATLPVDSPALDKLPASASLSTVRLIPPRWATRTISRGVARCRCNHSSMFSGFVSGIASGVPRFDVASLHSRLDVVRLIRPSDTASMGYASGRSVCRSGFAWEENSGLIEASARRPTASSTLAPPLLRGRRSRGSSWWFVFGRVWFSKIVHLLQLLFYIV